MVKNKKIVLSLFVLAALSLFVLPIFAFAQSPTLINISPTLLPGEATSNSPGSSIANFYDFALLIGGVLAFGVVVYGGVRYLTSAGNPSGQSDAKEWIWGALLGLLLLVGAYFILKVINPDLLTLTLPTLNQTNIIDGSGGGGTSGGGGGNLGKGCSGDNCVKLPNCTPGPRTNCGGAPAMKTVLDCINQSDPNYTVNEGYPPTVTHSDPGHNNGCAIDVHVNGCSAGSAFMAAASNCHASKVLNEYKDCGGTLYQHTSGGNIHIDAPKGTGGC